MSRRVAFLGLTLAACIILAGVVGAVQAQTTELPSLTELGPYAVGMKIMQFVDPVRENWTLETYVWFPADPTQGREFKAGSPLRMGAVPDLSAAPYPLIIYSHNWQSGNTELSTTIELLASHGYMVAAPTHHDTVPTHYELVDRPLDIMLVLNSIAAITEGDLNGMTDTSNVGLMGSYLGAASILQVAGLLRDPVHFSTWCADHPELESLDCVMPVGSGDAASQSWPLDEIASYRQQIGLANLPDGQWAPFGDDRIHAVLAIAPRAFPFTSDAELAAVTTPIMIVQPLQDEFGMDYEGNGPRTYLGLGSEYRYLLTVINGYFIDPWLGGGDETLAEYYARAFFGRHLSQDENFTPYLAEEHVPSSDIVGLYFGVYPES